MPVKTKAEQRKEDARQVKKYARLHPLYVEYAEILGRILNAAVKIHAPLAIVQTREKGIASFAEKIQRNRSSYTDPVSDMTDLCGGRVIVQFRSQVNTICEFIKEHFLVDEGNSTDVSERLSPVEFGYRSIHYIVQFKPGVFPNKEVNVKIPAELFPGPHSPMKAEIQVRTIMEHGWADVSHDLTYKSAFNVPDAWKRQIHRQAAMLEEIDDAFDRIQAGFRSYAAEYGNHMKEQEVRDEIENLEIVLKHDKRNTDLAVRIAKLAVSIADWKKATKTLLPYVTKKTGPRSKRDTPLPAPGPVLRVLGFAHCQKHSSNKKHPYYRRGRRYLEQAVKSGNDAEALSLLASTWKGEDDDKALKYYRRAHEVDPTDAYPLGNYLDLEILRKKDTSIIRLVGPVIDAAIQRCRGQVEVGMNMPWALYNIGKFNLLRNKPYESFAAYAKAIQLSSAAFMIETSLKALERLEVVKEDLEGYPWIRRLLTVGVVAHYANRLDQAVDDANKARDEKKAATKALRDLEKAIGIKKGEIRSAQKRFESAESAFKESRAASSSAKSALTRKTNQLLIRSRLAGTKRKKIEGPVILVVGGTAQEVQDIMEGYRDLMLDAFKDFNGTVISGATTSGIPGLVGELGKTYRKAIRTLGYLPRPPLPPDARRDSRYSSIRRTEGKGFSPLEPLQAWIDILASGLRPSQVKVLGINGGQIAWAEYRIGLALGAKVGVIEGSGREAQKLLPDDAWGGLKNLLALPAESKTVRAFIGTGSKRMPPEMRDIMAKAIHEKFRETKARNLHSDDPSMADWRILKENLKESNRQQADDHLNKLRAIKCTVREVTDYEITEKKFSEKDINTMAELEHARWNIERLLDGWKYGEKKDVEKKISPYLVAWKDLPEDVKDWDRKAVENIPAILKLVGLEVQRK